MGSTFESDLGTEESRPASSCRIFDDFARELAIEAFSIVPPLLLAFVGFFGGEMAGSEVVGGLTVAFEDFGLDDVAFVDFDRRGVSPGRSDSRAVIAFFGRPLFLGTVVASMVQSSIK